MEYKIVSGGSPSELTTKVNEKLNDGWELVGSHQVVTENKIGSVDNNIWTHSIS